MPLVDVHRACTGSLNAAFCVELKRLQSSSNAPLQGRRAPPPGGLESACGASATRGNGGHPSTSTSPRRWQVVVRLQVVVTDDPPTPRGQLSSGMAAQEVVRLKSFLLRAVEVFTIIPYNLLKCCHMRVRSQTSPPVSRLQTRLLLYDHSGPFFQLFACGAPQDTGILLFLRSARTSRTRWALTLLACMTR